jgi:hypothetical protein
MKLKYFKKKLKRYEVVSLMAHIDVKDEMLKKAQDEGWEICGDILIKNKDGWCGNTFFHIPMKRKL